LNFFIHLSNAYLLYFGLFKITKAPIIPGTHPAKVSKRTIKTEPHPLSKTDNGGKKMANKTLQKLIIHLFYWLYKFRSFFSINIHLFLLVYNCRIFKD